ncbi:MAG: hypothetical protein PUB67_06490 [Clostridiales bacterium]|nr:hypothetical protein [Clostridiales bacterium]
MNSKTNYLLLNKLARKHGIALFGSTYMNSLPLAELLQDYGINNIVYKRCIDGLRIEDAEKHIDSCVVGLLPEKLIINIGEEDITDDCDMEKLIEDYRWLLYNIHAKLPDTRLYLTSVVSEHERAEELNAGIKRIAAENGCDYIRLYDSVDYDNIEVELINRLKPVFVRTGINYSDLANEALINIMLPN